uniref:PIH1 N-terminal domain-containing protein n=1 Tax=Globisporangium ultimum (strain ATCC 200006 / CBS 805.95 / DAOM BR144) TaxID=431595 RepID=K3WAQ8_GLOUD
MEQYADWLDNLERTDPQAYNQLIASMKAQLESAGPAMPSMDQKGDADSALFEMLKATAKTGAGTANDKSDNATGPICNRYFKPLFPGNKVMEASGLAAKQEGVYIDVHPGFVMKTSELKSGKKVFVNVCYSDEIQTFSQQKKLDDEGNEQEGIHVPLSLGALHEVKDKKGTTSLAFDVAVNTQVVEDCKIDKTGSFRNFVCELAIEYIDQKYKVKLDARYKLPRLSYRGDLSPPKHYIRKVAAPKIQDVTGNSATTSTKTVRKKPDQPSPPTISATARWELHEVTTKNSNGEERLPCTRIATAEKDGKPLSQQILQQAGEFLEVTIWFQTPVESPEQLEIELRPELLGVKSHAHHDLSIFLPYPVQVSAAQVALNWAKKNLTLRFRVDKTWGTENPDCGSAPWLLAQALHGNEDGTEIREVTKGREEQKKPKSLAEMFHLERPDARDAPQASAMTSHATKWDPVDDDEELPEDRFHRKDMMSMHILEQRKAERDQKAKEAKTKRKQQRAEVEEKQRKAREAGKTWREMYPNDPETTYIDMEDILEQQKQEKQAESSSVFAAASAKKELDKLQFMPTKDAIKVAAAWSENNKDANLDLRSALAFELLE